MFAEMYTTRELKDRTVRSASNLGRCATNRGLLYKRATIQFLNFFGLLLTILLNLSLQEV